MELLRQPQFSPYPVEEQVISVWAGLSGLLDIVPVVDILRFERELLDYMRRETTVLTTIAETRLFPEELQAQARAAVDAFEHTFRTSDGVILINDELSGAPISRSNEIDQEEITTGGKR